MARTKINPKDSAVARSQKTKTNTKNLRGPARDSDGKFASGSGGLKQRDFNWKRFLPVAIVVALVGGFLVYRGFAATSLLAAPGTDFGSRDCTDAGGSVARETSGNKRNSSVCQLGNGRTITPIRFVAEDVQTVNLSQYLAETAKLTGGSTNMEVCYTVKVASGTSASITMGGFVSGGSPSGGHAHPISNTTNYEKVCDPALYPSNTRVFLRVSAGTIRIGAISLQRKVSTAPPVAECEGPRLTMNACLNPASIPRAHPGISSPNVTTRYGSGQPIIPCGNDANRMTCPNQGAAFRTNCRYSHMAKSDGIVYPGREGASHWHTFYGNTYPNHNLTDPVNQGNSTCDGGTLNRTSYWAPTLIDTGSYNSTTKQFNAVAPINTPITNEWGGEPMQVYYKSGYKGVRTQDIVWFPRGLKMIAGGNPSEAPRGPASPGQWNKNVYFDCLNSASANDFYNGIRERDAIPRDCPAGKFLQATVVFPQCGARNSDGSPRLDSPDHRSHMSYPVQSGGRWVGCPSSHPISYPEITEHFRWVVPSSGTANLRFSSDLFYDRATPTSPVPEPGWTFHADWFNGWDEGTSNSIIANCFRDGGTQGSDCQMNFLGTRGSDGRFNSLGWN